MTPHDPFARPTIVEALCEVYFSLPEGREWDDGWFGELFRRVEGEFPRMEPRQTMSLHKAEGASGVRGVVPVLGMLYRHRARPLLRQLFQDKISVNHLEGYPGWEAFTRDVKAAWEDAISVVAPASVHRIGLRYINRIPRSSVREAVGEWLATSEYYPSMILSQRQGFHSRFEHRPADGVRLVVTVADERAAAEGAAIIFDLDAILEATLPPRMTEVMPEIEALHQAIWSAFSSALSPRLREHLNGGAS